MGMRYAIDNDRSLDAFGYRKAMLAILLLRPAPSRPVRRGSVEFTFSACVQLGVLPASFARLQVRIDQRSQAIPAIDSEGCHIVLVTVTVNTP
jgi:hypothetical protein